MASKCCREVPKVEVCVRPVAPLQAAESLLPGGVRGGKSRPSLKLRRFISLSLSLSPPGLCSLAVRGYRLQPFRSWADELAWRLQGSFSQRSAHPLQWVPEDRAAPVRSLATACCCCAARAWLRIETTPVSQRWWRWRWRWRYWWWWWWWWSGSQCRFEGCFHFNHHHSHHFNYLCRGTVVCIFVGKNEFMQCADCVPIFHLGQQIRCALWVHLKGIFIL